MHDPCVEGCIPGFMATDWTADAALLVLDYAVSPTGKRANGNSLRLAADTTSTIIPCLRFRDARAAIE